MLSGIRIADFDRQFQFESVTETVDSTTGGIISSWTSIFSVKGKIIFKGARESYEGNQPVSQGSATIYIRPTVNAVNSKMRVKDVRYADYYYINNVVKNPREGYFKIECETRDR